MLADTIYVAEQAMQRIKTSTADMIEQALMQVLAEKADVINVVKPDNKTESVE